MTEFVDILIQRIEQDPTLTEAGLAKRAGLDNSTIRQMIKYRRNPRIDTAVKICRALGETVESFMAGGQDPAISELLFHLDQLTDAERAFLLGSAKGLIAQRQPDEK